MNAARHIRSAWRMAAAVGIGLGLLAGRAGAAAAWDCWEEHYFDGKLYEIPCDLTIEVVHDPHPPPECSCPIVWVYDDLRVIPRVVVDDARVVVDGARVVGL